MGCKREFKGTAAEQAMARFLVGVAEGIGLDTAAKVAERFPRALRVPAAYFPKDFSQRVLGGSASRR